MKQEKPYKEDFKTEEGEIVEQNQAKKKVSVSKEDTYQSKREKRSKEGSKGERREVSTRKKSYKHRRSHSGSSTSRKR